MATNDRSSGRRQLCLIVLILFLGGSSAAIYRIGGGYWDFREWLNESRAAAKSRSNDEFVWPRAKFADRFETSCLSCHSARLPLSQPGFARKKWGEVVHKMVAVYGAPISPSDEPLIVEYLLSAQAAR